MRRDNDPQLIDEIKYNQAGNDGKEALVDKFSKNERSRDKRASADNRKEKARRLRIKPSAKKQSENQCRFDWHTNHGRGMLKGGFRRDALMHYPFDPPEDACQHSKEESV